MSVQFEDYSAKVKAAINDASLNFLREMAFEIESEAKRNTPTDEPQLKGSWNNSVNESDMSATIGSPLENALWNEYGTGSHAEAKHGGTGKGRKGWWVYVKDQPRSQKNSTVYANEDEARAVAASMREQGLDAYATNGKTAKFTLYNAFQSKKAIIQKVAEDIFGGMK